MWRAAKLLSQKVHRPLLQLPERVTWNCCCSKSCFHHSSFTGLKQHPLERHVTDPALYDEAFDAATNRPEEFWAQAAEGIVWNKKWNKVLDTSRPHFPQW